MLRGPCKVTQHESSARQVLSAPGWLDVHFAACADRYRELFEAAALPYGGRLLDAGCGTGSYLPLLELHAGPEGSAVALDLADANIAHVRQLPLQAIRKALGSVR